MSDLALVALITAMSGILAAGLTGWITYRTTERHVQARRDEFSRQLEHDQEEARRDRLIEARKGYLIPLRSSISDTYAACSTYLATTSLIKDLREAGLPIITQMRQALADTQKTFMTYSEVVNPHIGQIADLRLKEVVSSYTTSLGTLSSRTSQMLSIVNAPGNEKQGLQALMDEINQSLYQEIYPMMLLVNQRIEELLSGD